MKGIKKIFMVAALSFSMLATSVSVQNVVGTQETVQAATIKLNKNKIILKTGARTRHIQWKFRQQHTTNDYRKRAVEMHHI